MLIALRLVVSIFLKIYRLSVKDDLFERKINSRKLHQKYLKVLYDDEFSAEHLIQLLMIYFLNDKVN